MEHVWSSMKGAIDRRSFMKNGLTAAGVATVGAGLLADSSSVLAEAGPEEHSGRLTLEMRLSFASRRRRKSWRPTFGCSTTNSGVFKTAKYQVEAEI